jgi:hypothetical protein
MYIHLFKKMYSKNSAVVMEMVKFGFFGISGDN